METITTHVNIDVSLVGGHLRSLLEYDSIPHPKIENVHNVSQAFQQVVGFEIPNLTSDLKHAYNEHESLRETHQDIDLLVKPEIIHPLRIALVAATCGLTVKTRENPYGISFTSRSLDGVKIDLTTDTPSPFNSRTAKCALSLDLQRLTLIYTSSGLAADTTSSTLSDQELELKIIGDMATMDTERAISLTLGFISKSLIEKMGKRIPINFGCTQEEIKNTKELLILSLSLVLINIDEYQKYYDRLLYNILNWEKLDPRIQEIIILAFQFVNHEIKLA